MASKVPSPYFLEPKRPQEFCMINEQVQDNRTMIRLVGSQMINFRISKSSSSLNTCNDYV